MYRCVHWCTGDYKPFLASRRIMKEFDEQTWMEVRVLVRITVKNLRDMADAMEAFVE